MIRYNFRRKQQNNNDYGSKIWLQSASRRPHTAGYSPGNSLIISAPRVNGKLTFLKEHQQFIVRMMQGNDVYGFESAVLKYYSSPFPHAHLRHPKDIERITVRGSRRVDTELLVLVKPTTEPDRSLSASMLNSSATGALLQLKAPLGELEDELSISLELTIAGITKYVRLKAIIRNITPPGDSDNESADQLYKYGVQFSELTDEQTLLINAYVYEQIVLQMEEH